MTRPPTAISPSISLSANRFLLGRDGQGSMLDADTVNTAAKNVKPKSDETSWRRCVKRRALYIDMPNLRSSVKVNTSGILIELTRPLSISTV